MTTRKMKPIRPLVLLFIGMAPLFASAQPTSAPANAAELYLRASDMAKTDSPSDSSLSYRDYPPYGAAWDALAKQSWDQNAEARALAHQATTINKADWSIPTRDGTSIFNHARHLANVLGDAALYQHFHHDDSGALETLSDLDHLATLLCEQVAPSDRISPLVGIGIDALTTSRLQTIVAGAQLTGNKSDSSRVSTDSARAWIQRLLIDRISPRKMVGDLTDHERAPFSKNVYPDNHFDDPTKRRSIVEVVNRVNADRAMAAMTLACHLFQFDHHRWPASLDELIPAYLPKAPLDPWGNGKDTLGYALIPHGLPNGENRPLVYRRSEEHDGLFFRTDRPTYAYYAWSEFPPDNARKMGGQFRDVVAWVPKQNDAPIPTTQPLNTNALK